MSNDETTRQRCDRIMRQSMAETLVHERNRAWRGIEYARLNPGADRAAAQMAANDVLQEMIRRCDASTAYHLLGGNLGLAYASARLSRYFRDSWLRMNDRHAQERAARAAANAERFDAALAASKLAPMFELEA